MHASVESLKINQVLVYSDRAVIWKCSRPLHCGVFGGTYVSKAGGTSHSSDQESVCSHPLCIGKSPDVKIEYALFVSDFISLYSCASRAQTQHCEGSIHSRSS